MPTPRGAPFIDRYGPVALIAGASEGIGAAFARHLAAEGLSLVLVARRAEPLEALAVELRGAHGVDVLTLPCDLGAETAAQAIADSCQDLDVGLLVYNAASASLGGFLETSVDDHLRAIAVNARGPLLLAHAIGRRLAARGHGGIVLMSSLTAFQGTPFVAAYGATKAFNLVLAEGLWSELASRGIDVLACCAGATRTPGYNRSTPSGSQSLFAPKPQDPDDVAREALEALGKRPFVVTGLGNRVASFVMRRALSRRLAIATIAREMRKRYD